MPNIVANLKQREANSTSPSKQQLSNVISQSKNMFNMVGQVLIDRKNDKVKKNIALKARLEIVQRKPNNFIMVQFTIGESENINQQARLKEINMSGRKSNF